MQNHDFGTLEMLFSSTRTDISGQKCIWMGEKKYTKILLGILGRPILVIVDCGGSGPDYAFGHKIMDLVQIRLRFR